MDLISRQAAIDAVHKSIFDFFDICDDDEESPMTYKDERLLELNKAITTQIKAVPSAQPEPHWIPCSDRYPDMDERVLVYTVAHEYHVWDCMSNRADNYFWEDEEGLYHDKYVVDLWMPLPEPYKENT